MDSALAKMKQGLETSQHTAPNWAESIKKVSASDCNQAKMDTAIEWMQQNLEEIRTENEHAASNQAGHAKKMAAIKSNQAKILEIYKLTRSICKIV